MKLSGPRTKPLRMAITLTQDYFRFRVSRTAAQLSYYLMFSMFPLLMIILGMIGFLHLEPTLVLQAVADVTGGDASASVLNDYITYVLTNESPGMMWAGIVMSVTASSAAFRALLLITGEAAGRPAFRGAANFLVSLCMSVVLLITIFCFLLSTVTGRWLLNILVQRFHFTAVTLAWQWLRYPVIFVLSILALTAIYRVCLSKKALPESRAWPGALAASVALVLSTAVFSAFISMSSRYSLVYGSLAGIVILMLWFFLCGNILALGSVFNCVLAQQKQQAD